jgi:hypothetical protein
MAHSARSLPLASRVRAVVHPFRILPLRAPSQSPSQFSRRPGSPLRSAVPAQSVDAKLCDRRRRTRRNARSTRNPPRAGFGVTRLVRRIDRAAAEWPHRLAERREEASARMERARLHLEPSVQGLEKRPMSTSTRMRSAMEASARQRVQEVKILMARAAMGLPPPPGAARTVRKGFFLARVVWPKSKGRKPAPAPDPVALARADIRRAYSQTRAGPRRAPVGQQRGRRVARSHRGDAGTPSGS